MKPRSVSSHIFSHPQQQNLIPEPGALPVAVVKRSHRCRGSNLPKCSHMRAAIAEKSELFGQLCWRA